MNELYSKEIRNNVDYLSCLSLIGRLSNMFAQSDIPYIHYRITENLFCKCFDAENLARFDDSYDAKKWNIGIGIKTFILPPNGLSTQKIAEFDSLAHQLVGLSAQEAAVKVANWRNQRIETTNIAHGIVGDSIYHIIGRGKGIIKLFVTSYDMISENKIIVKNENNNNFSFSDGTHDYFFNRSKSVLLEKFQLPADKQIVAIPIEIEDNPFDILKKLSDNPLSNDLELVACENCGDNSNIMSDNDDKKMSNEAVVLPLFSTREHGAVPQRSGLNQWNALGRPRDLDEVYIPVPMSVHKNNPTFFPEKDRPFSLKLPNGVSLSAKMCQDGRKGLMSNPNKALGKWLLRDVLQIPYGQIVTREMLDVRGIDSVVVLKDSEGKYRLELSRKAHYLDYDK